MRIIKISFIAIFFNLFYLSVSAQVPDNTTGYPVLSRTYVDVEGSPFLANEYNKGTVKMANGITFKDILIKYNQVDDVLYFQGKNDDILSFVEPVMEFTIGYIKGGKIINGHYRNGYPSTGKNTDKSFYEVLTDGTAQLLKRTSKSIFKNKPYNSATETQTVNEDVNYYIFTGGKLMQIKKDKKTIFSVLSNKQTELEAYINYNSLNLKNDGDLTSLIVYYNSL